MALRKGFAEVEEIVNRSSSGGKGKDNITYVNWGTATPDNEKILRFLSEGPIIVPTHKWVKTPDGNNHDFVCAKESLENPRNCPICETEFEDDKGNKKKHWPSSVGMCIAVLRKADYVEGPNGRKKKIIVDEMTEVETDGETKSVPQFGIVKQGVGNFWKRLGGFFVEYGSVLERDYKIRRTGEKLTTDYEFIPQDVVADLDEPEKTEEFYSQFLGKEDMTFDSPIEDYINFMSSESRYNKLWFGKDDENNEEVKVEEEEAPKKNLFSEEKPESNDTSFSSLREMIEKELEDA